MSKSLISTSETYRVDSEEEAQKLIQENKENTISNLIKYSSIYKEQKVKGEVAQSWYRVTLTKIFNDEKEPDREIIINYDEN